MREEQAKLVVKIMRPSRPMKNRQWSKSFRANCLSSQIIVQSLSESMMAPEQLLPFSWSKSRPSITRAVIRPWRCIDLGTFRPSSSSIRTNSITTWTRRKQWPKRNFRGKRRLSWENFSRGTSWSRLRCIGVCRKPRVYLRVNLRVRHLSDMSLPMDLR